MNNITKKLELKAELIKHLETANKQAKENKPSSDFKAMLLEGDIRAAGRGATYIDQERIEFWRDWLAEAAVN